MPFEFSKFITIDPLHNKGWMVRAFVRIKTDEIDPLPEWPKGVDRSRFNYSKAHQDLIDQHSEALRVYIPKIRIEHQSMIEFVIVQALLERLVKFNPEMEVEPEFEIVRSVASKGPAIRMPQWDHPYAYFDTTIWIYDSCDPEASSNLKLYGYLT